MPRITDRSKPKGPRSMSGIHEEEDEDGDSPLTAHLLEYADHLGAPGPLTIWLAEALQQHNEATQQFMERKFSELKSSLEHAVATGTASISTRRDSRLPTKGLAAAAEASLAKSSLPEDNYFPLVDSPSLWQINPPNNYIRATALDSAVQPAPSMGGSWDTGHTGVTKKTSCTSRLARGCSQTQLVDGVPAPRIDPQSQTFGTLPTILQLVPESRTMRTLGAIGLVVVTLNAAVIFLDLEVQGIEIAEQLGIAPDTHGWDLSRGAFFEKADHVFSIFYVLELAIKLALMGRAYFRDPMNILDASVVALYFLELLVLLVGATGGRLAQLTRLFKVSKVLRLPRMARASSGLCSLTRNLYFSLKALGGAAVLLALIVLITGLAMAHLVSTFLLDDCSPNVPMCEWAYLHYGSATRASWTMFQATLSGGWTTWAADLVEGISGWYLVFWVIYVIVVWFGVLRVITALFVKQTMEVAAFDHESMIKEKMQQKGRYAAAMRKFFVAVDENGDGTINYNEFRDALHDPKATAWLQALGIEGTEIDALFHLLDDGDGCISFDEFLASAVRLRGWARASDQIAILCNQRMMCSRLEQLSCDLRGGITAIASAANSRNHSCVSSHATWMTPSRVASSQSKA